MKAKNDVLIVYYSLAGNTGRVANDLARHFNADVECIVDMKRRKGLWGYLTAIVDTWRHKPAVIGAIQHDPSTYSLVLLGTPVWGWNITPALRAYLEQTRGKLRNIALFITSGDTDVSRIVPFLRGLSSGRIVAAAGFNARELHNADLYRTKLEAYMREIESASAAEPTLRAVP